MNMSFIQWLQMFSVLCIASGTFLVLIDRKRPERVDAWIKRAKGQKSRVFLIIAIIATIGVIYFFNVINEELVSLLREALQSFGFHLVGIFGIIAMVLFLIVRGGRTSFRRLYLGTTMIGKGLIHALLNLHTLKSLPYRLVNTLLSLFRILSHPYQVGKTLKRNKSKITNVLGDSYYLALIIVPMFCLIIYRSSIWLTISLAVNISLTVSLVIIYAALNTATFIIKIASWLERETALKLFRCGLVFLIIGFLLQTFSIILP